MTNFVKCGNNWINLDRVQSFHIKGNGKGLVIYDGSKEDFQEIDEEAAAELNIELEDRIYLKYKITT